MGGKKSRSAKQKQRKQSAQSGESAPAAISQSSSSHVEQPGESIDIPQPLESTNEPEPDDKHDLIVANQLRRVALAARLDKEHEVRPRYIVAPSERKEVGLLHDLLAQKRLKDPAVVQANHLKLVQKLDKDAASDGPKSPWSLSNGRPKAATNTDTDENDQTKPNPSSLLGLDGHAAYAFDFPAASPVPGKFDPAKRGYPTPEIPKVIAFPAVNQAPFDRPIAQPKSRRRSNMAGNSNTQQQQRGLGGPSGSAGTWGVASPATDQIQPRQATEEEIPHAHHQPKSVARLKKEEKEQAAQHDYYEGQIVDRDTTITELQAELDKSKLRSRQAEDESRGLQNENTLALKRIEELEREKEKSDKDLANTKARRSDVQVQLDDAKKTITGFQKRLDQAKRELSDRKDSDQQLRPMRDQYALLQTQHQELQQVASFQEAELKRTQDELSDIFNTGTLSLDDLLKRARIDREGHPLSRQTSIASTESLSNGIHNVRKRGTRRTTSGMSLQEEMGDSESSSELGDESADNENGDETIHAGQNTIACGPTPQPAPQFNEQPLGLSNVVVSLDTAPDAASPPTPFTMSGITTTETTPAEPTKGTKGTKKKPKPTTTGNGQTGIIKTTYHYEPFPVTPKWFWPVFFLILAITMAICAAALKERFMWASANDLARRNAVVLSTGRVSVWSPFFMLASFFAGTVTNLLG